MSRESGSYAVSGNSFSEDHGMYCSWYGGQACSCFNAMPNSSHTTFAESETRSSTTQLQDFPSAPPIPPHPDGSNIEFDDETLDHLPLEGHNNHSQARDSARQYNPAYGYLPTIITHEADTTPENHLIPSTPGQSGNLTAPGLTSTCSSVSTVSSPLDQFFRNVEHGIQGWQGPSQPTSYRFFQEIIPSADGSTEGDFTSTRSVRGSAPERVYHFQRGYTGRPSSQRSPSEFSTEHEFSTPTQKSKQRKRCDKCGKWLAGQDGLRRHLHTHDKNKKDRWHEVCDECRKPFKNHKDLMRHKVSHSPEKKWQCIYPNCYNMFNRSDNTKRHVIKNHAVPKGEAQTYVFKLSEE